MFRSSDIDLLSAVRLAPGVTVERMGEEFLALVGRRVVRVAGPSAVVLAAVLSDAGSAVAVPCGMALGAGEVALALDVLVDLGVLERTAGPAATLDAAGGARPVGVSRRRALRVAAAGALGVSVLVLPQAPAAASVTPESVADGDPPPVAGPALVLHLDAGRADSYLGIGTAWADLSGSGNPATLAGTPTPTASADGGGSLEFAGGTNETGPYATVADSTALDTIEAAATFEIWLRLTTVTAAPNMLFSKRTTVSNGYVGFVTSTGWTFRFGTGGTSRLQFETAPETDVWRQVVAVIGPAGSRVHVNGAAGGPLVASDATYTGDSTGTVTSAALDLFNVNPRPQTGPVTLDGRVAIVRFYASALTPVQVQQNYEAERLRFGLPAL